MRRFDVRDDEGRAWLGLLTLWRITPTTLKAVVRVDRVEPPGR